MTVSLIIGNLKILYIGYKCPIGKLDYINIPPLFNWRDCHVAPLLAKTLFVLLAGCWPRGRVGKSLQRKQPHMSLRGAERRGNLMQIWQSLVN